MSAHGSIEICFNLARAANGAIGYHDRLPWRLPNDLKRFKALSMGKPIIMGRRVFEKDLSSKPLPGRLNIVCTRGASFAAEGILVALSVEEALRLGRGAAEKTGADEVHVIGGAQIFNAALPYATRIYLTEVEASPAADTYLDAFDPAIWLETFRESHGADERHTYAYSFVVLERKGAAASFD
ncbi:MAG: dihydrofolate reductase [Alphaproteobacteria bacterium]